MIDPKALDAARRIRVGIYTSSDSHEVARALLAEADRESIDIVFDRPPGPESGRFIEVEDAAGCSIRIGGWLKRKDGYWVLRIPAVSQIDREAAAYRRGVKGAAKVCDAYADELQKHQPDLKEAWWAALTACKRIRALAQEPT